MVSEIETLKKDILREIDYYSPNEKEKRQDRATIIKLLTSIDTKLNYMNATKIKDLTQAEQLTEILHRLKHLEKGQQAIKSHLWREKPVVAPTQERSDEITKYEAINYINNVVMPDIEAAQAEKEGEIGVQGLTDWVITQLAKPVAEYLKAQAVVYIGEALKELKRKAIPYAVQAADWIIDKLESIIVNKYKEASEEQQAQFKEEISKTFPNSRLLGKL